MSKKRSFFSQSSHPFDKEIQDILKSDVYSIIEEVNLIKIWQEKLPSLLGFKNKPWLFWVLFAQLIFLTQYLIVSLGGGTKRGLLAFGIYCCIISYAGILPALAVTTYIISIALTLVRINFASSVGRK